MMEFPGWSRDTRKQFEGNTMAGGTRTPVTNLHLLFTHTGKLELTPGIDLGISIHLEKFRKGL